MSKQTPIGLPNGTITPSQLQSIRTSLKSPLPNRPSYTYYSSVKRKVQDTDGEQGGQEGQGGQGGKGDGVKEKIEEMKRRKILTHCDSVMKSPLELGYVSSPSLTPNPSTPTLPPSTPSPSILNSLRSELE
eukprot:CAMPEP_0118652298 /NCGR_PEP_ID=MMETSP0785-20121206/11243_1 /TAXON_ID=91992 /ORGANISM="Bolidomonas pacifica, Strain CCMP 1866" /LENGTH=130 /DNA_ID=CAMNT_0006544805 /DNA_START=209 /DNA_END=598 /DNA_ORIENTATION=-